jgi:hypothetical protein
MESLKTLSYLDFVLCSMNQPLVLIHKKESSWGATLWKSPHKLNLQKSSLKVCLHETGIWCRATKFVLSDTNRILSICVVRHQICVPCNQSFKYIICVCIVSDFSTYRFCTQKMHSEKKYWILFFLCLAAASDSFRFFNVGYPLRIAASRSFKSSGSRNSAKSQKRMSPDNTALNFTIVASDKYLFKYTFYMCNYFKFV